MVPPILEKVDRIIDANRNKSIDWLGDLVRYYPEGEEAFQKRIADRLEALGCDVHVKKLLPVNIQLKKEFAVAEAIDMTERTHVIGVYKGMGDGRSLMLITHPDGNPINTSGWGKEPHTGQIIDGKMYGWAVADDSAGICMMTEAVDALIEAGFPLKGDVYLMSASAKRNAWGIAALLLDGYRADAALYLHHAESEFGMKEVKTLTSGVLKFRIKVKGMRPPRSEFVQTTFQHLGISPIDKAMYVIDEMKKFNEDRGKRVFYPPLNDYIGRGTNLLATYIESGRKGGLTDMAPDCTFGFGLTFPPPEDIDEIVKEVEDEVKRISDSDPWLRDNPLELEWIQGTQGAEIPMDHPIVVTAMDAIEDVTGEKPFSNPLYSKSDVRTPLLIAGIPNVGYGPLAGDLASTGGEDEWVDLDDYIRSIKVTARIIMEWCG